MYPNQYVYVPTSTFSTIHYSGSNISTVYFSTFNASTFSTIQVSTMIFSTTSYFSSVLHNEKNVSTLTSTIKGFNDVKDNYILGVSTTLSSFNFMGNKADFSLLYVSDIHGNYANNVSTQIGSLEVFSTSTVNISNWANYVAVNDLNMNNYSIYNTSSITTNTLNINANGFNTYFYNGVEGTNHISNSHNAPTILDAGMLAFGPHYATSTGSIVYATNSNITDSNLGLDNFYFSDGLYLMKPIISMRDATNNTVGQLIFNSNSFVTSNNIIIEPTGSLQFYDGIDISYNVIANISTWDTNRMLNINAPVMVKDGIKFNSYVEDVSGFISLYNGEFNFTQGINMSDKNIRNIGVIYTDSLVSRDGITGINVFNSMNFNNSNSISNLNILGVASINSQDGITDISMNNNLNMNDLYIKNVRTLYAGNIASEDNISDIAMINNVNLQNNNINNVNKLAVALINSQDGITDISMNNNLNMGSNNLNVNNINCQNISVAGSVLNSLGTGELDNFPTWVLTGYLTSSPRYITYNGNRIYYDFGSGTQNVANLNDIITYPCNSNFTTNKTVANATSNIIYFSNVSLSAGTYNVHYSFNGLNHNNSNVVVSATLSNSSRVAFIDSNSGASITSVYSGRSGICVIPTTANYTFNLTVASASGNTITLSNAVAVISRLPL